MLKATILICLIYSARARTRTCNLEKLPIETIPMSAKAVEEDPYRRRNDGEYRQLLEETFQVRREKYYDATVVKNGRKFSNTGVQEIYGNGDRIMQESLFDDGQSTQLDGSITETTEESFQGRLCNCDQYWLPTDDLFYCPLYTNQCRIWTTRYSRDYRVSCTKSDWRIDFSRYIWYYLCFFFALLAIWLFCSKSGHHAIKFMLSLFFSGMNDWIAETLLQMEIRERNRVMQEIMQTVHTQRRRDGWVSGYKLKIKTFSSISEDNNEESFLKDNDETCGIAFGDECTLGETPSKENETSNLGYGGNTDGLKNDANSLDNYDEYLCIICLLPLENGEQIADLRCGHFYHADCLSEWILKKNSCPLCQDPNIAEEIRSFEADDIAPTGNVENDDSTHILAKWMRNGKEKLIDFATGSSSRQKRQLRRNFYLMHGIQPPLRN
mmetsp:Transcript_27837/g.58504  ORF Transcript_27837/g.58504 Transcript_27837/m.58504 type:complete len:439 (+) Transcript_27837:284-1600(+)